MLILSDDPQALHPPVVNNALILTNVLVFLWMIANLATYQDVCVHYGEVPARFLRDHDWHEFGTLISCAFLHGGFSHLIGNMWFLYIFGDNVEDALGHWKYLGFYLVCAIFCDFGHIITNQHSALPCVGASGAISGVMAAYLLLYPEATVKTWWGFDWFLLAFRTHILKARTVIVFWFIWQIITSFLGAGEVAVFGHIGGFLAGMILIVMFNRTNNGGARYTDGKKWAMVSALMTLGIVSFYFGTVTQPVSAEVKTKPKIEVKKHAGNRAQTSTNSAKSTRVRRQFHRMTQYKHQKVQP